MSERYIRVFTQQGQYYCPGAPVVIQAGALLKDNQTGKILAQIKFKNISPKNIQALTVRVMAQDISGKAVAGVDEFQYLDLDIQRGEEFGQKTPIILPNAIARSFSCQCLAAVFDDGTVWNWNQESAWAKLPSPNLLSSKLDSALIEQYRRSTTKQAEYIPAAYKDLWYCTCGEINHKSEAACFACYSQKTVLASMLDVDTLKSNLEKYKAFAAKKKAEQAKIEAQQKRRSTAVLAATILALFVCLAVIVSFVFFGRENCESPDGNTLQTEKQGISNTTEAPTTLATEEPSTTESRPEDDAPGNGIGMSGNRQTISAGGRHAVAVRADGTVVATGDNTYGQCNVSEWTDIIAVSAGRYHTVGLKSDGTVVAVGLNEGINPLDNSRYPVGQCDVSGWTDIIAIFAGDNVTYGIRADGTMVGTGNYDKAVSEWTNIVDICDAITYVVGLRSDGTVVASGTNYDGECDVSEWTDIVAIDADTSTTIGLRRDGAILATGFLADRFNFDNWPQIADAVICFHGCYAITVDGALISSRSEPTGTDYVSISVDSAGGILLLKADGTVETWTDEWDTSGWTNIKLPN